MKKTNRYRHSSRRPRVVVLGLALVAAMTVSMLAVERLGIAMLTRPEEWQTEVSVGVAVLAIALLAGDVVLPVPSSVVLVGNGVVFGATVGVVVSTAGLVGGAFLGYLIGAAGGPTAERFMGANDSTWLRGVFIRNGAWVVAATRGVPLASEITALLAGATGVRFSRYVVAATAGAVAISAPLALLGSGAVSGRPAIAIAVAATIIGAVLWMLRSRATLASPVQADSMVASN
ncbi:VTT domain-containing protein [Ilumatobacter sp.]|uniref:VTT domain-containing protein n=1 Tax=Ilumatobacter sp. TaxID=1967498 RepID=UPI003AF7C572